MRDYQRELDTLRELSWGLCGQSVTSWCGRREKGES